MTGVSERLEHVEYVAKAIWAAEWEEPFPARGIQHAMALQVARAAIKAMGDLLRGDGAS